MTEKSDLLAFLRNKMQAFAGEAGFAEVKTNTFRSRYFSAMTSYCFCGESTVNGMKPLSIRPWLHEMTGLLELP